MRKRFFPAVRQIVVALAIFDLAILLVHFMLGSPSKQGQAALAFAQEINLIVPAHRPLFASEELGNTEVIVLAYRSGRHIDHKSLVHAVPNDYFLTSGESADLHRGGIRILAFSEINQVALVSILKPDTALSPKAVRTSG